MLKHLEASACSSPAQISAFSTLIAAWQILSQERDQDAEKPIPSGATLDSKIIIVTQRL